MIELNIFEQILLISALALAVFPASAATGIESCLNRKEVVKVALVFVVFRMALFTISFWISRSISSMVPESAFWIVLAIFLVLGLKMIFESIKSDFLKRSYDVQKTRILLLLAIALHMGDFIGGLAFGFTDANYLNLLIIIAVSGILVTVAGISFGRSRGNLLKAGFASLAGGLVLTAFALYLFLQRTGGLI